MTWTSTRGDLSLGQVSPPDEARGSRIRVASLLDLAGTKVAVVQKRAEARDYIDIDALLEHGIELPAALAAGQTIYGRRFNPLLALKALSYFDDVPSLGADTRDRLTAAVASVDPARLPPLPAIQPRDPSP